MNPHELTPSRARFLVPRALFLGVAVSFLGCCLAGRLASRQNWFRDFVRFHPLISPLSLFYPTASQVRQLCRARLHPAHIAVIVGGSSRLLGDGQSVEQVWTQKLQELLGPEYEVINLALPSGQTTELAAAAMEMLHGEYPRAILVADAWPLGRGPRSGPDGRRYRYFYWDAYYKGLLLHFPERDARLAELAGERERQEQREGKLTGGHHELTRRMQLDSLCYANDLWNMIAYTRCFTLWTSLSQRPFTRPRRSFSDIGRGAVPLADRYPAWVAAQTREHICRFFLRSDVADVEGPADPEAVSWADVRRSLRTSFPEWLRRQMLLVFLRANPYYVRQLFPEEQTRYDAFMTQTIRCTEEEGICAIDIGKDFTPADFADGTHLAESGGAKLAAVVAAKVQDQARRRGYTR
jgi:hypothetical protein